MPDLFRVMDAQESISSLRHLRLGPTCQNVSSLLVINRFHTSNLLDSRKKSTSVAFSCKTAQDHGSNRDWRFFRVITARTTDIHLDSTRPSHILGRLTIRPALQILLPKATAFRRRYIFAVASGYFFCFLFNSQIKLWHGD